MLTEESFSKANYWLIFIIIYNDYMHKIEVKNFNIFLIWQSSKYIQGVSDLFMSQGLWVMVFNVTFNNLSAISWWSVSLVEEIRVPGENHWSVTSHWQIYHIMLYRVHLAWVEFQLTTLVVFMIHIPSPIGILCKSPPC